MKEDSLFKHFMVIGSGAVINMIIGLFTTPLITRLVAPEQYGQLSLFNTYGNIVMMLFGLGMDQALVRFFYKEENKEFQKGILFKCWFYPVFILTLCAIPFGIWYLCSGKIQTQEDLVIVLLFGFNVMLLLVNRLSTLMLRLLRKSNLYSAVSIIHKLLYVILAILLIAIHKAHYFLLLVVATVMSNLVTTAIGILSEKTVWNPIGMKSDIGVSYLKMINYGVPLMIANGIYMIFQAIDKICLNHFCTYSDVGIYSSAMSLLSIIAVLRTTFNTIWAPATMEHYSKDPSDKVFYQKGNRYITVIMFLFGLSLILCKDIIVYFLGEKYRTAAMIMPCLLLQPIMYTVSETTVVGIYFMKKSYAQMIVSSVSCLFNLVGNIMLIPIIGPKGAAISTGLSYVLFFTLRTVFSNKFYYIDFGLGKFYAITLLTVLYALYNTFVPFNWLSIVLYLVVVATGFILYRETVIELMQLGIYKLKGFMKRGN